MEVEEILLTEQVIFLVFDKLVIKKELMRRVKILIILVLEVLLNAFFGTASDLIDASMHGATSINNEENMIIFPVSLHYLIELTLREHHFYI